MDEFEFYFSFYGLLLGLSAAEIANGLANAVSSRRSIAIGLLTPLLGTFFLLDISSYWIWTWATRSHLTVNWALMTGGLVVAITYYMGAALVFPRKVEEWPQLDDHYWEHKKFVVGGIIIANSISNSFTFYQFPPPLGDGLFWAYQLVYWVPLALLFFTRRRALDFGLFALLFLQHAGSASGLLPQSSWGSATGI